MNFDLNEFPSAANRALARVLLRNGLADEPTLARVLEPVRWVHRLGLPLDLGDLLHEYGLLGQGQVESARRLAAGFGEESVDGTSIDASTDLRIGNLAILNGYLESKHLEEAIRIQGQIRQLGVEVMLGKILVDKGFLTKEVLVGLLQMQRRPTSPTDLSGGASFPMRQEDYEFGRVALEEGWVCLEDVDRVVTLQLRLARAGIEKRMAELFCEDGILSLDEVESVAIRCGLEGGTARYMLEVMRAKDEERVERFVRESGCLTQEQILVARTLQQDLVDLGIERTLGQVLADKRWITREDLREEEGLARKNTRMLRRTSSLHSWMLGTALFLIAAYLLAQIVTGRGGSEGRPPIDSPSNGVSPSPTDGTDPPIPESTLKVLLEGVRGRAFRFRYREAMEKLQEIREGVVDPNYKQILGRLERRYRRIVDLMSALREAISRDPRLIVLDGLSHVVHAPAEGGLSVWALSMTLERMAPVSEREPDGPFLAQLLRIHGLDVNRPEDALSLYLDRELREEASHQAARTIRIAPGSREAVLDRIGEAWGIENPRENLEVVDGHVVQTR